MSQLHALAAHTAHHAARRKSARCKEEKRRGPRLCLFLFYFFVFVSSVVPAHYGGEDAAGVATRNVDTVDTVVLFLVLSVVTVTVGVAAQSFFISPRPNNISLPFSFATLA